MDGYSKEELEWKKGLFTERDQAFAETAIELSRTFEVSSSKVISIMNDIFWDSWDTSSALRYKIKNEYPLREINER